MHVYVYANVVSYINFFVFLALHISKLCSIFVNFLFWLFGVLLEASSYYFGHCHLRLGEFLC